MLVGLKELIIPNDGLRYSLVPNLRDLLKYVERQGVIVTATGALPKELGRKATLKMVSYLTIYTSAMYAIVR